METEKFNKLITEISKLETKLSKLQRTETFTPAQNNILLSSGNMINILCKSFIEYEEE